MSAQGNWIPRIMSLTWSHALKYVVSGNVVLELRFGTITDTTKRVIWDITSWSWIPVYIECWWYTANYGCNGWHWLALYGCIIPCITSTYNIYISLSLCVLILYIYKHMHVSAYDSMTMSSWSSLIHMYKPLKIMFKCIDISFYWDCSHISPT